VCVYLVLFVSILGCVYRYVVPTTASSPVPRFEGDATEFLKYASGRGVTTASIADTFAGCTPKHPQVPIDVLQAAEPAF
jgi:hypothetical protein